MVDVLCVQTIVKSNSESVSLSVIRIPNFLGALVRLQIIRYLMYW